MRVQMGPIKRLRVKVGTRKDFYRLVFFSDDLTLLHCSFMQKNRFRQVLLFGVLGTHYTTCAGRPVLPKTAREEFL